MPSDSQYLYTYVPKENTVATKGILSTRLSPSGWEKYRERTGKDTKDEVLSVLDSWDPGFKRSNAVSVLSEPIPDQADERMRDFRDSKQGFKIDATRLLAAGLIKNIRSINTGRRGTHPVTRINHRAINWESKRPGKFLFSNVPHYLVETRDGYIPPEYVEEIANA